MNEPANAHRSNAYHLFILVLTVYSLIIMVALFLPLSQQTFELLETYDTLICIIFLFDFLLTLRRSASPAQYFFGERGWLDLLGSIPSLGIFRFTALFRLARLSRLARIRRILRGQNQRQLVADVLRNRGQYATFVTLMLAMIVISLSSVLVLQFENQDPDANIKTGGDALWWAIVTITTVGYGDKYPVTSAGRGIAVFVMLTGVGIIGALASILSNLLVQSSAPAPDASTEAGGDPGPTIQVELQELRRELAALREAVASANRP